MVKVSHDSGSGEEVSVINAEKEGGNMEETNDEILHTRIVCFYEVDTTRYDGCGTDILVDAMQRWCSLLTSTATPSTYSKEYVC